MGYLLTAENVENRARNLLKKRKLLNNTKFKTADFTCCGGNNFAIVFTMRAGAPK
jgi:hypothetical protein